MVFQDRLDFVKTTVEEGLADFFTGKRQKANKISPHCVALVDQIASLTMRGGKRTRAFLCWLGAQTTKETKIFKELQYAMMAVELFQSFALIHDDIIDEDTTRRGGPTVNAQLGVSMAILAGDLALVWADELIKNVKAGDIYQKMKEEVIFGQSLDVMEEHMKVGIPKKLIDEYKTAWYSVIRPLQIGAAVAGADEKMLKAFVPYGLAVGEAYQLRDDYLDGAIDEAVFMKQKSVFLKRAVKAMNKPFFSEFARFALERQA